MSPTIHEVERAERRGRRLPAIAILAGMGFLAATWFGLFSFLGSNAAFGTIQDLEDHYICNPDEWDLDFPDLSRLSEVYTSDGVLLGVLTERNSQPTPIEEIPELVIQAILAAEDEGFYEHEGIDFRSIIRAVIQDARGGNRQGGSTITQQVVKSVFLSNEISLERKVCEAVIAAELERRYDKDDILEFYVNSVFYGSNAYGVTAAAEEYYGKELHELTVEEAAAMMTPIRNPSLYDLRAEDEDDYERVMRARNAVIDNMADNEFITLDEAEIAKARPLQVIPHVEFEQLAPQVIIAAREDLLNDPKYGLGDTFAERKRALFGCPASDTECEGGGGLEVHVTLDFELQEEANRILREWFPPGSDGPTGAIAMVENESGAIRVMSSGLDFGTDTESGERDYDLAGKGRRQAGSAFKPFTLVAALENGSQFGRPITLASYWDMTSPQKIDCGFPCSPEGNIWTCNNASRSGSGIRTLEAATYLSTNTVYCQVSFEVGPDRIVDVANRMGIESHLDPVLSITLGTEEVSPLEMAAAFSTIANYGNKADSYLIEKIVDSDGTIVYQHEVIRQQVIDEALAAAVVNTMKKTVSEGTGTAARLGNGWEQAGKTGTAQQSRDVWFMGFVPQVTTAVWVGYPEALVEMVDFTVYNALEEREMYIRRAFGGNLAAPIWKHFMLTVIEDMEPVPFPPMPEGSGIYFQTPKNEVPSIRGMSRSEAVTTIRRAGFNASVQEEFSDVAEGRILGQSPAAGTVMTQGRTVVIRVSGGLPPSAVLNNLVGVLEADVSGAVAAFTARTGVNVGWQRAEQVTTDSSMIGKVVATSPSAGSVLTEGATITIFIGIAAPDG